jgi:transcriptional regulator with XRE-family HTH domain
MPALALGEFIRKKRDELDLSLRELARRLDITPPFLSDIELGKRYPSEVVMERIAKELEVALDDLKKFDVRESISDLKKLMEKDPSLGVAFRTAIERVNKGEISTGDLTRKLDTLKKR